jgi:hypothetical protein
MTTLTDFGSNLGNILYSRNYREVLPPIPKRQKSEENTDRVKIKTENVKKIIMWKNAVDPTNATRNKFITVHGNTNEYNFAKFIADNELTNNTSSNSSTDNNVNDIENSGIFYTVPEGIILVDLALDNTVIYSNSLQDMENAVHKSHPNWITTPIFTDEGEEDMTDEKINNVDIKNSPSFNDKIPIKVQHGILDEELDETKKTTFLEKLNKIATFEIEKKAEETNNNSSARTIVKAKTITKDTETNLKKAKVKWGSNKLSDFRHEMVNIAGNIDESIAEPLSISVKMVEEIDKHVVKEEFGLKNDDLYSFDKDHPNFDPQGPNMPMLATHIYFPGDKIHNKMMEWDEGKDFNVFNMIDTKTIPKKEIDKKSIHNMLFEEAKEKTSNLNDEQEKEIEIIESYYIENSIKEYPSQIIYNAKSENSKDKYIPEEYPLLKVYEHVNKTKFHSPNREEVDWFPLQALIDKIASVENTKDNPIIIYLNSCSPTIRSTDEIIENSSFKRTRRRRVRNIRRNTINTADLKESLKKDDDDVAKKISKYLIQINDLKNKKYEIGRGNFIELRKQLKTDAHKVWREKYKTLTVHDLPRLHKTIVMMGKTERAEWYRNIMGAFFHQLKKNIDDGEAKKQQKSFDVIYKQAKRDAFNREIYVLRKNWKNYEEARSSNNKNWPQIKWPGNDETKCKGEEGHTNPIYMNLTTDEYCGGRKNKKTRKKRKKRRRKKTRRKRKKRRRKKTRKRRRKSRRRRKR